MGEWRVTNKLETILKLGTRPILSTLIWKKEKERIIHVDEDGGDTESQFACGYCSHVQPLQWLDALSQIFFEPSWCWLV